MSGDSSMSDSDMSDYEKAVQIADRYMEYMSSANYAGVMTLYAEDAILEDPVGSDVKSGKAAISEFYHGIGDAGLKCNLTGKVRYISKEMAFPFECIMESDQGTMKMEIIDHFILNDDFKIVSMRAFWGPETASMVG